MIAFNRWTNCDRCNIERARKYCLTGFTLFAAPVFIGSADAQVVLIPHGDYESNFEKILIVVVSLALLGFALRQSYKGGQFDWFKNQVRKIFRRDHR
jgi:hypothetical protein